MAAEVNSATRSVMCLFPASHDGFALALEHLPIEAEAGVRPQFLQEFRRLVPMLPLKGLLPPCALRNAVRSRKSCALIFAPCATKYSITSLLPLSAAPCRAVNLASLTAFTSTPATSSRLTVSRSSQCAAHSSAVAPSACAFRC